VIHATMAVQNPEAVAVSLTLTMSIADWQRFVQQLGEGGFSAYPSWKVAEEVQTLIRRVEQTFDVPAATT
jgi:hypothetical protein